MKDLLSDEKKNTLVERLGYYGPLLTETQRTMTQLYVDDDLSLSEIASQYGITRQSVCDTIKKAEKMMDQYEEKLKLILRTKENIDIIKKTLLTAEKLMCSEETAKYKDSVITGLKILLDREETDYGI